MNKNIVIKDRIFSNIEKYCKINGLKINSYIENALSDKINIDLYGDLNEINKEINKDIKISKIKLDIKEKIIYLHLDNGNILNIKLNNIDNFNEALNIWNNTKVINDKEDNTIIKRKLKIR